MANNHERSFGKEASFYPEHEVLSSSTERYLSGMVPIGGVLDESMPPEDKDGTLRAQLQAVESAIAQRQALQDGVSTIPAPSPQPGVAPGLRLGLGLRVD